MRHYKVCMSSAVIYSVSYKMKNIPHSPHRIDKIWLKCIILKLCVNTNVSQNQCAWRRRLPLWLRSTFFFVFCTNWRYIHSVLIHHMHTTRQWSLPTNYKLNPIELTFQINSLYKCKPFQPLNKKKMIFCHPVNLNFILILFICLKT